MINKSIYMNKKRRLTYDGKSERSYSINWGVENKKKIYEIDDDDLIYAIGTEIHFNDDVTKRTIEKLIKLINKVIHEKKQNFNDDKLTITYVVDSPGGCVSSILKFVDFVTITKEKYPEIEFVSIITGLAASAGTIMAIVADKRLITKNASAMIHELSSGNEGKFTHMSSYIKWLTNLNDTLVNIYVEKSSQTKEDIELLLKNETWYSAEDYLKAGFVDKIK